MTPRAEPVTAPEPTASRPKRVSKWDRPPEPHDWRFYVGGLGKILIATGLLMFGFVAYQLWGTGIETARAQNELENQFEQLLAESQTSTTAPTSVAPTTVPTTSPAGTVPAADVPPETTTEPSPTATSLPPGATFPTVAPAPVEQNIPPIERGQALARLEIPKIGLDKIVVPGVSLEDLKKGPGHYPETPLPGQLGNASIAGHRTTFGHPFSDIDQLAPGDQIIVTMFTGDRFVYEVASTEIVGPDGYHVVTTTDPTVAELTLTSCDPKYTARNRIAVHAFLVASESDPVGEPTFYDLEANGNESSAAGQDPAVRPDSTDASASARRCRHRRQRVDSGDRLCQRRLRRQPNPTRNQSGDHRTGGERSGAGCVRRRLVPRQRRLATDRAVGRGTDPDRDRVSQDQPPLPPRLDRNRGGGPPVRVLPVLLLPKHQQAAPARLLARAASVSAWRL